MKFFENIKTLDELRKEYRRLAFLYHPDKGGYIAIMQVITMISTTGCPRTLKGEGYKFSHSKFIFKYRTRNKKCKTGTSMFLVTCPLFLFCFFTLQLVLPLRLITLPLLFY